MVTIRKQNFDRVTEFSSGSYQIRPVLVLPSLTKFYREFYRVLSSFTEFYRVLTSFWPKVGAVFPGRNVDDGEHRKEEREDDE